jgi:hypothetical protein
MKEANVERRVDESVAKLENWYAGLPLAVCAVASVTLEMG